ncbi:hypothetical protein SARC_08993 [Sphaeroforma arctica JP610]|uniref:Uncharacterized protein n=1 Tax=Sphaeroforma arctica JP610 TaxID=667725 RepID=A0A0L0FQ06_9EUKA|nr:hypothetical protein SARC_08993 [Sphaeroforma arctica JP610]KNC78586.1 hypothetical protein SARC_08993 [Sphaeroforma arctica JP610]|eukprot:XP_014152488.1 hypothetical protein SARC_08993 [Sphaeroforma arctica JP610]
MLETAYEPLQDDENRKDRKLMYVRSDVARVYRHDKMRVVCVLVIDKDQNATNVWYVESIEECNCMLPLSDKKTVTTDEGEGDPGSTDAACSWNKRPAVRKMDLNQHTIVVAKEFVNKSRNFAWTVTRSKFMPLKCSHLAL